MDKIQSSQNNHIAAARKIWQSWQNKVCFDRFEDHLNPEGLDAGYAIQQQLENLVNEPVPGWKIAGTAAAGRHHINVDTPLAGRLFASRVFDDGAEVPFDGNRMAVAEAEIVLCLGEALPPRVEPYSREAVADAVAEVRVGLELPDSRFTDFTAVGAACLIADNACARDFVLGPEIADQKDIAATSDISTALYINDELRTEGTGADALGGPLDALVWLVTTLNAQGIGLQSGQFVTTGVTGKPVPIVKGDQIRVVVAGGASVSARLVHAH